MNRYQLFFLSFTMLLSGCIAQQAQVEDYGWHSTGPVSILTGCKLEKFYDDPLYYYHNEFDWLYLN